jgi:negative regulator of genetic competence, sporulation and motility
VHFLDKYNKMYKMRGAYYVKIIVQNLSYTHMNCLSVMYVCVYAVDSVCTNFRRLCVSFQFILFYYFFSFLVDTKL